MCWWIPFSYITHEPRSPRHMPMVFFLSHASLPSFLHFSGTLMEIKLFTWWISYSGTTHAIFLTQKMLKTAVHYLGQQFTIHLWLQLSEEQWWFVVPITSKLQLARTRAEQLLCIQILATACWRIPSKNLKSCGRLPGRFRAYHTSKKK